MKKSNLATDGQIRAREAKIEDRGWKIANQLDLRSSIFDPRSCAGLCICGKPQLLAIAPSTRGRFLRRRKFEAVLARATGPWHGSVPLCGQTPLYVGRPGVTYAGRAFRSPADTVFCLRESGT